MRFNSVYLPQEIWFHIFEKLDELDIEEVSLVCKRFLSITNTFRTSLNITVSTLSVLPGLLRRFQYLEKITISIPSSYDDVLHQISSSDSHHQGRKNLKTLNFGGYCSITSQELISLAYLFPWLEEISIPCPSKGNVFRHFQLKLLGLRKVTFRSDISVSYPHITIVSPLLNWGNLEEIDIDECSRRISEETIGYMMRHCPKLTCLRLPNFKQVPPDTNLSIQNSISYAKNLRTLSFHPATMSKDNLFSIVEAKPPLKKLKIDGDMETQSLTMLLQACPSIQDLHLRYYRELSDSSVEEISQHLSKLIHINLKYCQQLSIASFFRLTKNCHFLEVIKLRDMNASCRSSLDKFHKRERICHLELSRSKYLDDETLAKILSVCPNLRYINVSCCSQLTEEGVQEILKACVSLNKLNIFGLRNVADIFGKKIEGRTVGLKIIEAGATGMKDESLSKMGKICPSLEFLSIRDCKQVTKTGVMEVVRNCKNLKKINLNGCESLSNNMLVDMISVSSIKRIVLPGNPYPSEDEKKKFGNSSCKFCHFMDKEFRI